MPFLTDLYDIDPDLIDYLIEKEKNEQNHEYNRPFLYIPQRKAPPEEKITPREENNEENSAESGIIIIDL